MTVQRTIGEDLDQALNLLSQRRQSWFHRLSKSAQRQHAEQVDALLKRWGKT